MNCCSRHEIEKSLQLLTNYTKFDHLPFSSHGCELQFLDNFSTKNKTVLRYLKQEP